MPPKIRPYRAEDRASVRAICFDTGLMGESVAPQFADREAFADLFTSYYTDHEPQHCFVVESEDGRVVGYLVGTLDTRSAHSVESIMTRLALTKLLPLRPGTARFMWRALADEVRALARKQTLTKPDLDRFPAHTHFNLLPEARLAPIAAGLYRSFFHLAKRAGCPGIHGEVFIENERACALHKAMGFAPEGTPAPAPGLRGPRGERLHVQLWTRKL